MGMDRDIFDVVMGMPGFRLFEPFYFKHKEGLLYLFFGGLTFLVSVATYGLFNVVCNLNELVANILSWFIAVYFAYMTNRNYVFRVKYNDIRRHIRQMGDFFSARVLTLLLEELILFLFITKLGFSSMAVKVGAQFVVIVTNYILSKLYIFKKVN